MQISTNYTDEHGWVVSIDYGHDFMCIMPGMSAEEAGRYIDYMLDFGHPPDEERATLYMMISRELAGGVN